VHGGTLGEVGEHLDTEAAVEVVDDPLLPRSANDLGRRCRTVRGWLTMWSASV
jgi:hypothetical protein